MDNPRIVTIERGNLVGKRPRKAGSNARLPEHGIDVRESFARLRFEDGSSGFGYSRVSKEQASTLLGKTLDRLLSVETGIADEARSIEFPLWDALGQRIGQPVFRLIAGDRLPSDQPLTVPCYDTSLYFDDLHLEEESAAVQWIAEEARAGFERGHRAFKIKIGRGALHMPLIEGTQRDIAIINGVRAAVGPNAPLMIDANNGYNVNLVKWVLTETADCHIYWLEEAFHEDRVLYTHLRTWMQEQDLSVLIADGEGQASPDLLNWARDGVVDVIQYDLRDIGLSKWLKTGQELDRWDRLSAPHNYGSAFGNYATCHLAPALDHFAFVEWDHITLDGLDTSRYSIQEGRVQVPESPGFGLELDETIFKKSVQSEGFIVS